MLFLLNNKGLNYTINRKSGDCAINKLSPGSEGIDMDQNGKFKNVSSFFGFDGIPYQYVGLKRRDGVNTGKREFHYLLNFHTG